MKADAKYRRDRAGNTQVIGANTTARPTDNKVLRQAFNFAIDRKRMVDNAFGGTGAAIAALARHVGGVRAGQEGLLCLRPREGEVFAHKAGLSGLEFDIVTNVATPEYAGVSQIFQFDLQKLGIKANIKPYEPAGYLDQINNHKYTGTYVGSTAYASMLPSPESPTAAISIRLATATPATRATGTPICTASSDRAGRREAQAALRGAQRPVPGRVGGHADLHVAGSHAHARGRARRHPEPARRLSLQRRLD